MNNKKNILIINDDKTFCKLFKEKLNEYGIEVDSVYEGYSGIQAYSKNKYDLVFLDFYLNSRIQEFKLLAELKRLDGSIPIIMLTVKLDSELEQNCLSLGALDYFHIPFNWADMESLLKKYSII